MPDPTEKVRALINRTYQYKFRFVESALGEFGACGARLSDEVCVGWAWL